MVQVLLRLHSHGTGCTFDWLKICAFTGDLFTRNHLDHKKIWATSCSKFCANRAKILNGPVWMKCSVKFFNRLKIHQVPCEHSLRMTVTWHDITQSYTPNANMVHLSVGPGLVARKGGEWGLDSFVLTARLSDSVDEYGFLRVVTCLRPIK